MTHKILPRNLMLATAFGLIAAASSDALGASSFQGYFSGISATGNLRVISRASTDSAGMVKVDAHTEFQPVFSLRKGVLSIQADENQPSDSRPTVVTVYSDYLTSVASDEDAVIEVTLRSAVPEFSANVTGNGSITVSGIRANQVKGTISTGAGNVRLEGATGVANFTLVGSGSIRADELRADIVKCTCTGSGTIGCNPADNLDVKGLGTTKIYYLGEPDIKKLGNIKLFPLTGSDYTSGPSTPATVSGDAEEPRDESFGGFDDDEGFTIVEEEDYTIVEDPSITKRKSGSDKKKKKKKSEDINEEEPVLSRSEDEDRTDSDVMEENPFDMDREDKSVTAGEDGSMRESRLEEMEEEKEEDDDSGRKIMSESNEESGQDDITEQNEKPGHEEASGTSEGTKTKKVAKKRLSKRMAPPVEPIGEE